MSNSPVTFIIVGLGSSNELGTRGNVGHVFIDYLANCLKMQESLIKQSQESPQALKTDQVPVMPAYSPPVFKRVAGLLIHDAEFNFTYEDSAALKGTPLPKDKTLHDIHQTLRVILAKSEGLDCGAQVKNLLNEFNCSDPNKQLIVIHEDISIVQAAIGMSDGPSTGKFIKNTGIESICNSLETTQFYRLKIGIGRPDNEKKLGAVQAYLKGVYSNQNQKELDMLGISIETAAQAIQYFALVKDLKLTKKKYATSKKLPKAIKKMEGVLFPTQLEKESKVEGRPIPKLFED